MSEKEQRDKEHRSDKDKREKEEMEFSTTVRGAQAAEYLNRIADGLRQGTLTLSAAGQRVSLHPAETIRLEVEAESRRDKGASLRLDLSWKTARPQRESEEEDLVVETEPREAEAASSGPKSRNP